MIILALLPLLEQITTRWGAQRPWGVPYPGDQKKKTPVSRQNSFAYMMEFHVKKCSTSGRTDQTDPQRFSLNDNKENKAARFFREFTWITARHPQGRPRPLLSFFFFFLNQTRPRSRPLTHTNTQRHTAREWCAWFPWSHEERWQQTGWWREKVKDKQSKRGRVCS